MGFEGVVYFWDSVYGEGFIAGRAEFDDSVRS
jgi:hypothetical protein